MRLGSIAVRDRYWPVPLEELELIDDDPVVYAPAPFGAFPGELVKPRCYSFRLLLADCCCSTGTGDRR